MYLVRSVTSKATSPSTSIYPLECFERTAFLFRIASGYFSYSFKSEMFSVECLRRQTIQGSNHE